jgi:hypothetical protein
MDIIVYENPRIMRVTGKIHFGHGRLSNSIIENNTSSAEWSWVFNNWWLEILVQRINDFFSNYDYLYYVKNTNKIQMSKVNKHRHEFRSAYSNYAHK